MVNRLAIILDTSFLIALNNAKDVNYKRADSLRIKIKNGGFGQSYISDYIFDEFATFMNVKFPSSKINEIGDALLSEESIKMMKVDLNIFLLSWELFKKLKKLSFTDCTTVILCKEYGIKRIASFDSDFDRIPDLERVYKFF